MTKAVVFDLWETLAAWPHEEMGPLLAAVRLTSDEWVAPDHRDRRWEGSFGDYLKWVGLDDAAAASASEIRTAMTRRALVPIDGTAATLVELRSRGLGLGLVSNCSSEVGELWDESPFGGLFDVVVLSADVGLCKPDERIYRIVLERLGVDPRDALFVGDGHSRELEGAQAVGMRAVQIGATQPWDGERITTIPQVLDLL